jgi:hypothetical protein
MHTAGSDPNNDHVRVAGGERPEIGGIVRRNDAPTEADRSCDDQRIDRHGAVSVDARKQVPSDPRQPGSGRDDLRKSTSQNDVDRLVASATSVQLDQHRRRYADRGVAYVGTSHRRPHALVTSGIAPSPGER